MHGFIVRKEEEEYFMYAVPGVVAGLLVAVILSVYAY